MFDNIVSNKYFVIALVIALIVIIYLYSQKKSCNVENMQNLSPLTSNIDEKPWASDSDTGKYRSVKNYLNKKLKNPKRKRKDEIYQKYMENNDDYDLTSKKNIRQKRRKNKSKNVPLAGLQYVPQPVDDRPDLSQCQPCICPGDSSDSDSESDINYKLIKNNKFYRKKKN